ncbi:MAG: ECF transporter S component [Acetobacter sp.]|nr:ECF transporter S component [Bacteroides sp.]MCM1341080.1 ECF transporter S component [Acetobacter sp.]MCM1433587.1 ECF transporter S component [Clostridiales bacterium]
MNKMSVVKKSIITAVCIALCVVLPQAFHAIPNAGSIYCPMHIPVLLCGLVCGWQYGLICGIAGPLLSNLFTGMPPAAILPSMMIECAVYGLITGLVMKFLFTKKVYADLYISLISAMLCGRVISGIAKALIFAKGEITIAAWAASSFVTSLPGIIIQLVLIPAIVFALMKANLVPVRYPKDEE